MYECRTHPVEFVRDDAHADAGTANQDAPVPISFLDHRTQLSGIVYVVDARAGLKGAEIDAAISELFDSLFDLRLEGNAVMIGADNHDLSIVGIAHVG